MLWFDCVFKLPAGATTSALGAVANSCSKLKMQSGYSTRVLSLNIKPQFIT